MPRQDMEVLAPTAVTVKVGDRLYEQEPLTLRGTTRLLATLALHAQQMAASKAMVGLFQSDFKAEDWQAALPAVMAIMADIPDLMETVIAIILGNDMRTDEGKEAAEYLGTHITLPRTLRVLRTFVEQNEPEELIENFTVLRGMVTEMVVKAKNSAPA